MRSLLFVLVVASQLAGARAPLAQTPDRPPCWHEQFAAFSFLEGEWSIRVEDRLPDGTWETGDARAWIVPEFNGCALVENYAGTRDGKPFLGRGMFGVNIVTGALQRVWFDGEHGMFTTFEGTAAENEIALEYRMVLRGQLVVLREVYTDIAPDAFRLENRRSNDGGNTWIVVEKLHYTRVVAPPAQSHPSVELPAPLARVLTDYETAWQAKDARGLAALFAEDGFVLSGGQPPARGREAIEARYRGAGGPLALRALAYAVDGTAGYIIGAYGLERGGEDAGKFTLTLRKGADGRWLIVSDMDNSNRRR